MIRSFLLPLGCRAEQLPREPIESSIMTITIPSAPALRLGFIGGAISSAVGYTHWVASQLDDRWRLVSGCFSRDPATSAETGRTWHLPPDNVYSDWKDYVAQEKNNLDAVAVLTPTPDHVDIVCALLEAGIPVICEGLDNFSHCESMLRLCYAREK